MKPTHWHILGAGSLGCLWASYLILAGHKVTLVCKSAQQQGKLITCLPLTLKKGQQETSIPDVQITCLEKLPPRSITHLLVCLKAYQTEEALLAIKPAIALQATLILMQNGMGNLQLMEALFPACTIYAALTTEAACKYDDLKVEHTGHGNTRLGTATGVPDTNIMETLQCDLPLEIDNDIEKAMWQKLVINCCINPLSVIHRCKNGELANIPEAMTTIKDIIHECQSVVCAINKEGYLGDIEAMVHSVIDNTALNTSSMLQDVLHHRETEIDYINGFISRLGKETGTLTPANDQLVTLIKDGEYHA